MNCLRPQNDARLVQLDRIADEVVRERSDNPYLHMIKAAVLFRRGRYGAARDILGTRNFDWLYLRDDLMAALFLAMSLQHLGESAQARELLATVQREYAAWKASPTPFEKNVFQDRPVACCYVDPLLREAQALIEDETIAEEAP